MSSTITPDRHIAAARTRLTHLAGLAGKTANAERSILTAAEQRMKAVERELASVADRVLTDMKAAERYMTLTEEVGRLKLVIASAREALRQ